MDLKMWLIVSALILLGGVITQVQKINQKCFPFDQAKVSAQEGNEDQEAVQNAAADLGIRKDDFSSITELAFGCCNCTFKCWIQGGICLPSWLEPFFPQFNDQICSPLQRCSCFFPPKEDYCPCNKPCGNGGTCKSGCSWREITEESSVCSEFSDCQCCVDCNTKTCNGGQCRKKCAWNQYSDGNCPGSNCQCCKKSIGVLPIKG